MYASETLPDCRITIRRHPDTGERVGMDLVLKELSSAVLMHVDAPGLSVMDLTVDHRGIGTGLHLKPCYTIMMDVTSVKVALCINEWIDTNKLINKQTNKDTFTVITHGLHDLFQNWKLPYTN